MSSECEFDICHFTKKVIYIENWIKFSVYLLDIERIIWDSTQHEVCSVLANWSEHLQKNNTSDNEV